MPVRIKVEIPLKVVDDIVKSDDVGLFTSATWARYMDKYVPYYEGDNGFKALLDFLIAYSSLVLSRPYWALGRRC